MQNSTFHSRAWLLKGWVGSVSGVLTLQNGRFSFADDSSKNLFDVPISQVSAINFPWHYFGGGVNFQIGADKYRVSFARPEGATEDFDGTGDLITARENGKKWKTVLAGS